MSHNVLYHPQTTQMISTIPYQQKNISISYRTCQSLNCFSSSSGNNAVSCPSFSSFGLKLGQQKVSVKCGSGDRLIRPESKPRKDMKKEDYDEMELDINNIEEVKEKVELMEMEAIMGKDDGRDAMDYKRRAGIFYKSSQVFQANKEQPHHCT